jgi:hypothetical protein
MLSPLGIRRRRILRKWFWNRELDWSGSGRDPVGYAAYLRCGGDELPDSSTKSFSTVELHKEGCCRNVSYFIQVFGVTCMIFAAVSVRPNATVISVWAHSRPAGVVFFFWLTRPNEITGSGWQHQCVDACCQVTDLRARAQFYAKQSLGFSLSYGCSECITGAVIVTKC